MILAVTGGRDFNDRAQIWQTLAAIHRETPITLLVHGDCPTGADRHAAEWAAFNAVPHTGHKYRADWKAYGKSAGPRRNRQMLVNEGVTRLVAFPGGRGTTGCVKMARELGIAVTEVK